MTGFTLIRIIERFDLIRKWRAINFENVCVHSEIMETKNLHKFGVSIHRDRRYHRRSSYRRTVTDPLQKISKRRE